MISQVKTPEKDGYSAVQIGYGSKKSKHIKKPQRGHLLKAKSSETETQNIRWMKEFRVEDPSKFEVGAVIDAGVFKEGDMVKVSAISKGKGFQGVVKRHGFSGGPRTHGQKH